LGTQAKKIEIKQRRAAGAERFFDSRSKLESNQGNINTAEKIDGLMKDHGSTEPKKQHEPNQEKVRREGKTVGRIFGGKAGPGAERTQRREMNLKGNKRGGVTNKP